MKKVFVAGGLVISTFLLYNCHGSRKAIASKPVTSTYQADVKSIVETSCGPCHIPAMGGNKKPYDNYVNLKSDIDDIIRRIELNPAVRGFMPFKRPKLSDSTIAVFRKWKSDGLFEK